MEINIAAIQLNISQAESRAASPQKTAVKAQDTAVKTMQQTAEQNRSRTEDEQDRTLVDVDKGLLGLKAVFALDKEKNVVIRVLDNKGEIVRQYPPEEYINMIKKFRENVESLFSKEV